MRVLLAGYLAKPQVVPLAESIRQANPDISFEVAGSWLAESDCIASELPCRDVPRFLFSGLRRRTPRSAAKVAQAGRRQGRPRWLRHAAKYVLFESLLRIDAWRWRAVLDELVDAFDVVHLHSVFSNMMYHRLRVRDISRPIVVSLWGSDVLREHDVFETQRQQELLDKATLITYTTDWFQDVALAKFGHHLRPKFRETFFSADYDVCLRLAKLAKLDARRSLEATYGIPPDAKIVCVGHNASPSNQHLEVIASLARQSQALKKSLFVVVPMTYCQVDLRHIEAVKRALTEASLRGEVLTSFMSAEELAEWRKGSDMLIYVPVSDVFSATVSQSLIAQQVVIAGAWLPYRQRKREGFVFWEVERLGDIGGLVAQLVDDWNTTVACVTNNEALGMDFFAPRRIGSEWATVYREAVELERRTR